MRPHSFGPTLPAEIGFSLPCNLRKSGRQSSWPSVPEWLLCRFLPPGFRSSFFSCRRRDNFLALYFFYLCFFDFPRTRRWRRQILPLRSGNLPPLSVLQSEAVVEGRGRRTLFYVLFPTLVPFFPSFCFCRPVDLLGPVAFSAERVFFFSGSGLPAGWLLLVRPFPALGGGSLTPDANFPFCPGAPLV